MVHLMTAENYTPSEAIKRMQWNDELLLGQIIKGLLIVFGYRYGIGSIFQNFLNVTNSSRIRDISFQI
jgi:hypothetical protein